MRSEGALPTHGSISLEVYGGRLLLNKSLTCVPGVTENELSIFAWVKMIPSAAHRKPTGSFCLCVRLVWWRSCCRTGMPCSREGPCNSATSSKGRLATVLHIGQPTLRGTLASLQVPTKCQNHNSTEQLLKGEASAFALDSTDISDSCRTCRSRRASECFYMRAHVFVTSVEFCCDSRFHHG